MTPQELRESILWNAIQGKYTEHIATESSQAELCRLHLPAIDDSEVYFDIPQNWKWCRIGDIFELVNGKAFKPTDWSDSGVPIVRIQNLNDSNAPYNYCNAAIEEKYYLHGGELLFSWSGTPGTSFGAFIWNGGKAVLNQHIFIVYPQMNADSQYLMYALNAEIKVFIEKAHGGAGLKHITKKDFDNCYLPVPPLAEQKRIVAKIEELLPLIDRYETAYTRLEEFNKRFPGDMQKSLLQMAIQGKLVDQRPEEGTGEELFRQIQAEKQALISAGKIKKDKPLPEITDDEKPFDIPESWKWVRLGNITSFQGGYAFKSTSYVPQSDNQVIRLGNVKPNSLLLEVKQVFIPDDIACQAKDYQLKKDDILVTMTGTRKKRDYFFTLSICESDLFQRNLYLNQRVGCLRAYRSIDIKYLLVVLQNEGIKDLIFAKETGTANQGNIGSEDMKQFILIPIPPLAEQKRIVAKLEELLPLCERLK